MTFVQILLFISLIVFTPYVFSEVEVWQLNGHYYKFNRDHKTDYLVSAKCLNQKCIGALFLKKTSFKNIPPEKFRGGRNTGSVLCLESKDGDIVILKDLKGNENCFCRFKDKSFVSCSSISSAASENDQH